MPPSVNDIIRISQKRSDDMRLGFDPISGKGSIGPRKLAVIPGFPIPEQWLPTPMFTIPLVKKLIRAKSLDDFISSQLQAEPSPHTRNLVISQFVRLRCRYDFPFWAATFVFIKNKNLDGPPEVLFRLNYPQRILVQHFEQQRLAGKPIRTVLLKARQWGGSTTSQLYMAWLQLNLRKGLNSLIIAHQGTASDEIKDMFDRMIKAYPLEMLHSPTDIYPPNEPKMVGVGHSGAIFSVPQRSCKIKIGTAERPDSSRGGDYSLVHLSEVGLWKNTLGKKPDDIVRAACAGVLYRPLTMIVYESTANGLGNFFHNEYSDACKGKSQFLPLFIPWYQIDWNIIPFDSDDQKRQFAQQLIQNRNNHTAPSNRHEPGSYLWWLWLKGATLEALNWYIHERAKYADHGAMASECPSDHIEAFVNSGAAVFDKYLVEAFRPACSEPAHIGELAALADEGQDAISNITFNPDPTGLLWAWALPDPPAPDSQEYIADRYLTVVDIGGRSRKADWSVIVVFDRIGMLDGEGPAVVAQWYGHCDIDIPAWKAAQIAAFYDNALLVIESNTLETHDRARQVDGDQSQYILNQISRIYPNLYARRQSEDEIRLGLPRRYGFHTNTATKPMIIANLVKVVRQHTYIERDQRCLDEYLCYERKQNGAFGAIPGRHDDLLMTRAIALHICFNEMPLPSVVQPISAQPPSNPHTTRLTAASI